MSICSTTMYTALQKITVLFLFTCFSLSMLSAQSTGTVAPYSLYKQGRLRESIENSLILIKRDKNNISAYAVAGLSYLGLKQWSKALEISKEGYKLAPNDLRLLATIGEAYYELNKNELALEYLSRYVLLGQQGQGTLKHWMYYYMAVIYKRLNKLHKADIALSAAIFYDSLRTDWILELAQLKEKKGEKNESLVLYKKVLSLEPTNRLARQKVQQDLLSN